MWRKNPPKIDNAECLFVRTRLNFTGQRNQHKIAYLMIFELSPSEKVMTGANKMSFTWRGDWQQ